MTWSPTKDFAESEDRFQELWQQAFLTPLERRIVILLLQGYRTSEIAAMLALTQRAVRRQLNDVFQKLGVSDPLELVFRASERLRARKEHQ